MPTADFRGWAGRSHGWRYIAERVDGTGTSGTFLVNELPLHDVSLTQVLAGPTQITGVLERNWQSMVGTDGYPIFGPWNTMIHAEADGEIRGSAIFIGAGFSENKMSIDCSGFTTVLQGIQFPGQIQFSEVDPLDIIRYIWAVVQTDPQTNLSVFLDPYTTTDRRVGGLPVAEATTGTTSVDAGSTTENTVTADEKPFALNWYDTPNCGDVVDKLCADNLIEYRERTQWNSSHTAIGRYLDFGYPSMGARRTNLRFVGGENIQVKVEPQMDGEEFANHVTVLGAGEGSAMVQGTARINDGRIRRQIVVDDKSITDTAHANRAAQLELARRGQLLSIDQVIVRNTPSMAPFGSFQVGDEIRIQTETEWMPIDWWCRVTSMTISPEEPDLMALTVFRSDWVV